MKIRKSFASVAVVVVFLFGSAVSAHVLTYSTVCYQQFYELPNGGLLSLTGVFPETVTFDEGANLRLVDVQVLRAPTEVTSINEPFGVNCTIEDGGTFDIVGILGGTIGPTQASLTVTLINAPASFQNAVMYQVNGVDIQSPALTEPPGTFAPGFISLNVYVMTCLGPPPFLGLTASPAVVRVGDYANIVIELGCSNSFDIPVSVSVDRPDILQVPTDLTIPVVPRNYSTFVIPTAAKTAGTAQVTVKLPSGTKTTTVSVMPALCRGDLDGDGKSSIRDAVTLLRAIAGLDPALPC